MAMDHNVTLRGRCDHWPRGGAHCASTADVQLLAPDGQPVMRLCQVHADAVITEYREKLGEKWRARRLDDE